MKRFWLALTVALFFYAKMDILIWQRIFETHELIDLGVGVYHWGWVQALFGFMILGVLLFYPDVRRMITFPLSLGLLAFSGLEDILYYWLDDKSLPQYLPWLNSNPLLLKPVTAERLLLSAALWLLAVLVVDVLGVFVEKRLKADREGETFLPTGLLKLNLRRPSLRLYPKVDRPGKPTDAAPEIESSPG
jgi:hypothetical protein